MISLLLSSVCSAHVVVTRSKWVSLGVGAALSFCGLEVHAQSTYEELSQRIKAPTGVVEKFGPDLFGDKTNLYNGKLEFTQVDVSLPGNSALPVRIARHLDTGVPSLNGYGHAFGLWDLEIPRIHGIFSYKDGFVADPKTAGRCSSFGLPLLPKVSTISTRSIRLSFGLEHSCMCRGSVISSY